MSFFWSAMGAAWAVAYLMDTDDKEPLMLALLCTILSQVTRKDSR